MQFSKSFVGFVAFLIVFSLTICDTGQAQPSWEISVKFLIADNCPASGCSCLLGGGPHHDMCRAVGVMQITEGNYGDVSLTGQNFGITLEFTSEETHYMAWYIDESASTEVKNVLRDLLSNPPFGVIGEGFEIKEASMKFNSEKGQVASFSIGEFGEMTFTPMIGGDGKTQMSIINPTYPFPVKEIFLSSAKGNYEDYGKELKLTDHSGEVGEFTLKGGGE